VILGHVLVDVPARVCDAPHSPRRMKHVDMRELAERRRQPVQRKARLDQRQVERFPVVADHRARLGCQFTDGFKQRTLRRKVGEHELPDPERSSSKPAAADEERVGTGAAGDAGGLKVDEEQVRR